MTEKIVKWVAENRMRWNFVRLNLGLANAALGGFWVGGDGRTASVLAGLAFGAAAYLIGSVVVEERPQQIELHLHQPEREAPADPWGR